MTGVEHDVQDLFRREDSIYKEDLEEVVNQHGYEIADNGYRVNEDRLILDLEDADGWGNDSQTFIIDLPEDAS